MHLRKCLCSPETHIIRERNFRLSAANSANVRRRHDRNGICTKLRHVISNRACSVIERLDGL